MAVSDGLVSWKSLHIDGTPNFTVVHPPTYEFNLISNISATKLLKNVVGRSPVWAGKLVFSNLDAPFDQSEANDM